MADKDKPLRPYRAARPDSSPQAMLLAALHQRLPARAAHVFAGLSVAADHTIQVHATVADAALLDEIARTRAELHSAVPVQVLAGCRNTLAKLEQVRDALTARRAELAARGIHLREWGPDIVRNRVRVGLGRVTPAATAWLEQEFGAETIAVVGSGGWSFYRS